MAEDPLIEIARRLRIVERYVEEARRLDHYTSPIADYLHLPELRGFWPASSVDETVTGVRDLSEQGRTLTINGGATRNIYNNVIPYIDLNGSTQYLSRADEAGLDVPGNLMFGGWFWVDTLPGANAGLIGKYAATGNQRSYLLFLLSSGVIRLVVSGNGTAAVTVDSAAITTGKWNFVAGRYAPSSEIAIFVNGQKATNTTSIPATLFNSTAALQIGAFEAANFLDGRAALCFVCATSFSDELTSQLFQRTRGMFGT